MSVFGVLVSGRLVQTDFQRVDETHFMMNIHDADSINHVVVFLTGAEPLPEGFGGSGHNARKFIEVKDAWRQISLDEIKASIDQFLPRVQEVVNQQGGPIQH
ncbi:unnamed protein product, partial [Cyprideis torosa]